MSNATPTRHIQSNMHMCGGSDITVEAGSARGQALVATVKTFLVSPEMPMTWSPNEGEKCTDCPPMVIKQASPREFIGYLPLFHPYIYRL